MFALGLEGEYQTLDTATQHIICRVHAENVQSSYKLFHKKSHILNKSTVLYWAIFIVFIFTELSGLHLSSKNAKTQGFEF